MVCDGNCFECKFPDCILDFESGSLTDLEIASSLQVDEILFGDEEEFIEVPDYRQYPFIPSDEIPYNSKWKSQAKWREYYRSRMRGNRMEKERAYRKKNKEKINARSRKYYAKRKENILLCRRKYFQRHKEEFYFRWMEIFISKKGKVDIFGNLSEYQEYMVSDILEWCYTNEIHNIDKLFEYAKENCLEWFSFLSDSYNFEVMQCFIAYDEMMHFCDGCKSHSDYECQHCPKYN